VRLDVIAVIKMAAVLAAAALLGHNFLQQSRANRAAGRSPMAVFRSIPGLAIILVILLPILVWFFRN